MSNMFNKNDVWCESNYCKKFTNDMSFNFSIEILYKMKLPNPYAQTYHLILCIFSLNKFFVTPILNVSRIFIMCIKTDTRYINYTIQKITTS